MIFNSGKEKKEIPLQVVVIFTDGHREYLDFSFIKILENCLIIIDPVNEMPCEVHCYPLSGVKSFIFDYEAIKEGKTNLEDPFNGEQS